jgi:hypothetical protein
VKDLKERCEQIQERELSLKELISLLQQENEGLKQSRVFQCYEEIIENQLYVIKNERDILSNQIKMHHPFNWFQGTQSAQPFVDRESITESEVTELKARLAQMANENEGLQQQKQCCEAKLAEIANENERLKQQLQLYSLEEATSETRTEIKKKLLPTVDLAKDPRLIRDLKRTFTMMDEEGVEGESEEGALYDAFIDSLPSEEREITVQSMFGICNDGKRLKERELQKFHERTSQTGKRSFATCLHSIGGRYRHKQSKRLWLNVRRNAM